MQDHREEEYVVEAANQTYARVSKRWEEVKDDLFSGQCGFSILGSPPRYRPQLMIIGENPGFGADDVGHGAHLQTSWPTTSYAEGERWALKDRLVEMFEAAGLTPVLREAVVTNFLFFKSGSHTRETDLRWSSLPRAIRSPLEGFCLEELLGLVTAMQPQQIMILGMGAFGKRLKDQSLAELAHDGKRWLIGTGTLWGVPAFGMMHPTGAFWASEDRKCAARWLRDRFAAGAV